MKTILASLFVAAVCLAGFTSYRLTAAAPVEASPCVPAHVYTSPEARRHVQCQPPHWRGYMMQR